MSARAPRPVASLPMYDAAPLQGANDRLWHAIARALTAVGRDVDAPSALTRGDDLESVWRDPALVVGQTCGYPYVARLRDAVTLVGTPDHGVVAGRPGWYRSRIVVRADDPRETLADYAGARFACNARDSQSGCLAMMFHLHRALGDRRLFAESVITGAHAASIGAVAGGRADIAAIDAVSWRQMTRHLPATRALRVLADTEPTPGLPYITARRTPAARGARIAGAIADAIEAGIAALAPRDRDALGLRGLWRSSPSDYDLVAARAARAATVRALHGLDPGGVGT